ncbi:MAG TPA: amidohydrolase family protein [Kofleriaceae bacterium]|nr:amidohydrolase family protein [Kofleriaceae bacterium]
MIRGGEIIDGSGAPRRRADVAIVGQRIVAIGDLPGEAARTLDATGKVIAPGFVDVHTHYDAQIFWEPALPSLLHGVTTVFAGNCGFSIAPLTGDPDDTDFVLRMLARTEGMAPEVLRERVPWSWRSTAEYLDLIEGKVGTNIGLMVGHSTLRRAVMGRRATAEAASPEDLAAMQRLLRAGLEAGAVGFSSSRVPTHDDGDHRPVPSRSASTEELLALASVTGEVEGTSLQIIAVNQVVPFQPHDVELLTGMSLAGGRPINWNTLHVNASNRERGQKKLEASDHARARGAKIVALMMPMTLGARFSFRTGFMFDAVEGWGEAMRAPLARRIEWLRDPHSRRELGRAAASEQRFRALVDWDNRIIFDTFHPKNHGYRGRYLGDIAEEEGRDAWDVLCDIAVADELRTTFGQLAFAESLEDWQAKAAVMHDPRTVVGGSDAGAHVDMIADFAYPTRLLADGVREHGVLTLEDAVHQLTERPAQLYGLRERGKLAVGWYADFVVFDADTVDAADLETHYDLPGDSGRLHADSIGVDYVGVNGALAVDQGRLTGVQSGTVLRSGKHTTTPSLD